MCGGEYANLALVEGNCARAGANIRSRPTQCMVVSGPQYDERVIQSVVYDSTWYGMNDGVYI